MKNEMIKKFALFALIALLVNFPIIFIFTVSYLMIYDKRLNNNFIFFYTLITFSLIFYLRLYGDVTSINNSSDDAITYLKTFSILENYGYIDFFEQATSQEIAGLEPLYWLFFYIIGLLSDFNKHIFVFFNYFTPILLFLYFLRLLFKEKYLLTFLLITTFAYQYYYAMIFSTWRQSLAFAITIMSLYFISKNKKIMSFIILISAFLVHTSGLFFFFMYSMFILVSSKIRVSYLISSLFIIIIVLWYIFQFYGFVFEEKLDVYTSGRHVYTYVRSNFIIKFTGALLISFIILRESYRLNDQQLKVLAFFTMIGNIFILLTMDFETINTRLQLYTNLLFMITLCYFMVKYHDFKKNIYIFVLLAVLVVYIRLMQDSQFFSMFLLDGKFDESLIFSIRDFYSLLNTKRGFE